jgi:hypothetical protein
MAMKGSEFYRAVDELEQEGCKYEQAALEQGARAASRGAWPRGVFDNARKLRKEADDQGVPTNARDEIERYHALLEEGPPDGEGYVQPKEPERTRAARKPCDECGNVGRHKVNPPCSKSGNAKPAAREPLVIPAAAEMHIRANDKKERSEQKTAAEDVVRVALADLYARYKALVEKAPQLPSEAAKALGVDLATLKAALEHSPS